jgi:hypothetical protein
MRWLCLLLLPALFLGCRPPSSDRDEKPSMKGMELYSWKSESGGWCFSLLPGTNRLKPMSEITRPEYVVTDMMFLKARITKLAAGEQIFWRNLAKERVPRQLVKDVKGFCEALGIEVELIQ